MLSRKWFLFSGLTAFALTGGLWMIEGCSGKLPPIAAVLQPAAPPLPPDFISDFENGKPLVSPTLLNSNNGVWRPSTFGGSSTAPNVINGPILVPNTVADATDSSKYAIHIFASLENVGSGCGYESDQLVCPLYHPDTNTYYDASSFTGIQFMLNIPPDDQNFSPVFQVVVAETEPPPAESGTAGGTCLGSPGCGGSCFNHFQVALPASPGVGTGGWVTLSFNWASFNSPFSSPPQPLSYYLNHIIFLQWTFSNNTAGFNGNPPHPTDFWVDNVKFLP